MPVSTLKDHLYNRRAAPRTTKRLCTRRKNLFLQPDSLGGSEDTAPGRDGLRSNKHIRMTREKERSLETSPLGLTQERPRAVAVRYRIEPPCSRLGVAIPRYIHRSAGGGLVGNNGRLFKGKSSPVRPESAVVLDAFAQKTGIHISVQNGSAIGLEFCQGTLRAPVHQSVAVGQDLGAALGLSQETIRGLECLNDLCSPGRSVDGDDLALGERVRVDFVSAVILSSVGGIIK